LVSLTKLAIQRLADRDSARRQAFFYLPVELIPIPMKAVTQSSAIYFKRHKASKRRAALFRQLYTPLANQLHDVTVGKPYIAEKLPPRQLLLRGFAF
jgi:hypothetical protein